jgi:hypothetical protein
MSGWLVGDLQPDPLQKARFPQHGMSGLTAG